MNFKLRKTKLGITSVVFLFSCRPNDEKLQKQIETVLMASQSGVSSSVKDGVVTLTGVVESEEAKMAAEQVAKSVKDVKTVVNNIEVKTLESAVVINPDEVLKTSIITALATAGYKTVEVGIKDVEVMLTGSVKTADRAKVMQIANEAKPKKVTNQLKIN